MMMCQKYLLNCIIMSGGEAIDVIVSHKQSRETTHCQGHHLACCTEWGCFPEG